MKKFLALLAVLSLAALMATAAAAHGHARVLVAMHDPGCHWFLTHGKYTKSLTTRGGSAVITNMDEATIIIKGTGVRKLDKVGKTVKLARGKYVITMVKQAPDDNHLHLTVR